MNSCGDEVRFAKCIKSNVVYAIMICILVNTKKIRKIAHHFSNGRAAMTFCRRVDIRVQYFSNFFYNQISLLSLSPLTAIFYHIVM